MLNTKKVTEVDMETEGPPAFLAGKNNQDIELALDQLPESERYLTLRKAKAAENSKNHDDPDGFNKLSPTTQG